MYSRSSCHFGAGGQMLDSLPAFPASSRGAKAQRHRRWFRRNNRRGTSPTLGRLHPQKYSDSLCDLRALGSVRTILFRPVSHLRVSIAAIQRGSLFTHPLRHFCLLLQPGFENSHGIEHGLPLTRPNPNAGNNLIFRELPQQPRGDVQCLRSFSRAKGQRRRSVVGRHHYRSNGSRVAKYGSHTRWRSVRLICAEQSARRNERPGKSGSRAEKYFSQVFGIRCRTIEQRTSTLRRGRLRWASFRREREARTRCSAASAWPPAWKRPGRWPDTSCVL